MKYVQAIKAFIGKMKKFVRGTMSSELQPKDILAKLLDEMESRKKLGIEEVAFVPNVYVVYLSPSDYEEMSPLLTGIKEQLKNRVMAKVSKKGYKLLSSQVVIDIREDEGLLKNQVVVESSFLKEKMQPTLLGDLNSDKAKQGGAPVRQAEMPRKSDSTNLKPPATLPTVPPSAHPDRTHIIEDRKTRIIEDMKVKLEILQGTSKGDVVALDPGEYTFGRGSAAQVLLADPNETISRIHFKLTIGGDRVHIRDMGSANGTKVNGIEIEEAELKKGDVIEVGKAVLKVA